MIDSKKLKMQKKLLYCKRYEKFKNPKISYIFEISLVRSIIYSKSGNEDEEIFKEVKSIEPLKTLDLIVNTGE